MFPGPAVAPPVERAPTEVVDGLDAWRATPMNVAGRCLLPAGRLVHEPRSTH